MNRLMEVSEADAELVFMATRDKQREKFAKMQADKKKLAEQIRPECGTSKKGWVSNLSNHQLSEVELAVLRRGMNFAPTQKQAPKTEIIAGVEQALRQCKDLDPEKAERARAAIANVIRQLKPRRRT